MAASSAEGLRCPYCRAQRNRNLESHRLISLPEIRRRKECLGCHRRYTTRERLADAVDRIAAPLAGLPCARCAQLEATLEAIGRALEARDPGTAVAAVERIMPLFDFEPVPVKRIFTATVLQHWYRLNLNLTPLVEALRRDRRDLDWQRETQRLIALTLERAGAWEEALLFWDGYLTAATRAGTLPAAGRAPARVLLHMAELFPAEREAVLDRFCVASEEDLEALIRAGELPEWVDRGRLLARARQADPDPRVFQALVAHWETREPRQAEALAEAWRQAGFTGSA